MNIYGWSDMELQLAENLHREIAGRYLPEISAKTELLTILNGTGIALLLILGTVIIINQIRIHKQLQKIQKQLEQKENGEE